MPAKKLEVKRSSLLQIRLLPDEHQALEAWCAANRTTMSDVVRELIAPHIAQGKALLSSQADIPQAHSQSRPNTPHSAPDTV